MADETIALRRLLEKPADATFLRDLATKLPQGMIGFAVERLIELAVVELTSAAHGKRSLDYLVHRNGYQDRD